MGDHRCSRFARGASRNRIHRRTGSIRQATVTVLAAIMSTGVVIVSSALAPTAAAAIQSHIIGIPSQLVFTVPPPSSVEVGTSFDVAVSEEDAAGNVEINDNTHTVSLSFGTNPDAATLTCSGTTVETSNGVATFVCSINKVGTGYTLEATTDAGAFSATSDPFDITPLPTQLAIATEPALSTQVGDSFSVAVQVEDAANDVLNSDDTTVIDLAILNNPGGGSLTCTNSGETTVSSGLAQFTCSIDSPGTGYTLQATSPSLTSATTNAFDIVPGPPAQLVFTGEPPATTAAGSMFAVAVSVEDAAQNVVTADSSTVVDLALGANPGSSVLSCSNAGGTAVTASAGVANFMCSINRSGTGYTLVATDDAASLTSATSTAITVTPGPPAQLVFTTPPPSSTEAGTPFGVGVSEEDAAGNVIITDNTSTVTLSVGTNPASGTLSCTGSRTATVAAGVADFTCSLDHAGNGYSLDATSGMAGVSPASSVSFDITAVPPSGGGPSGGGGSGGSGGAGGSIAAPAVSGISPTSGPSTGGTAVTIAGSNFSGATEVEFGGHSATTFTVVNPNEITAVSPPGIGTADVQVVTPGGTSAAIASDRFTYVTCHCLNGSSYWLASALGTVTPVGGAPTYGSAPANLAKPIVGIAATPDGGGYWLAASDGGVFAFGDARFFGSTGALRLNKPVVGIAATPDGGGYWLVASDGGVFTFGDARFFGSTGALRLNKPVVGIAATPDGGGYWLVASDGGVFTFGDARFFGSTGAAVLNEPIVGMASVPGGGGYWLVGKDGGVFAFGGAPYQGSVPGLGDAVTDIVGAVPAGNAGGYSLIGSDGTVFGFGGGVSAQSVPSLSEIVGLAAT